MRSMIMLILFLFPLTEEDGEQEDNESEIGSEMAEA